MTIDTPSSAAWEALPNAAKTLLEETHRTLQERRCQPSETGGKAKRDAIMRDAAGRLGTVLNEAAADAEGAVGGRTSSRPSPRTPTRAATSR